MEWGRVGWAAVSPPVLWLVLCRPSAFDGARSCLSRGSEPYTNTSSRFFSPSPSFPASLSSFLPSHRFPLVSPHAFIPSLFPFLISYPFIFIIKLYFFSIFCLGHSSRLHFLFILFSSLVLLFLFLSSVFSLFVLFIPHAFILSSFPFL